MYDIINPLSLDNLQEWTQIIRKNAGDIPILLVGNNLNLEKSRKVSREEGILTAKKYNLFFQHRGLLVYFSLRRHLISSRTRLQFLYH